MSDNSTYKTDDELTKLYNSLPKGDLVRMLIDKQRELEKQVNDLDILGVSSSVSAIGFVDAGKTTLTAALETAAEMERGIVIVHSDEIPNDKVAKDKFVDIVELIKKDINVIDFKPSKRDKFKKPYHK